MEVEQYLSAIPDGRRERFQSILRTIRSLYPDAVESMKYKMPTYSLGDGWVAVANQKNYISLYTCAPQHIASFQMKHPTIKTGKGCINFRDRDEILIEDIKPVIRSAIEYRHD